LLGLKREICPGACDRGLDLGPVAHDPGVAISKATFASSKRAIFSGSKPSKARRKASRLRRMVIHDRPAWKPSSSSFSNSARLSCSGTPHSSS
jgi:hypothetical protein